MKQEVKQKKKKKKEKELIGPIKIWVTEVSQ